MNIKGNIANCKMQNAKWEDLGKPVPFPNLQLKNLHFAICNLQFPNSCFPLHKINR